MYIHSYVTMNNKKLRSSTAIFLAAVLVVGVIGIASPSIAFADKEDKKYEKQSWKHKKAECSVNNFNINEVTEFESQIVNSMLQHAENPSIASIDENMDPTVEAMDASVASESNDARWGMESNGDGGGIDVEIENICLNFGENDDGIPGDGGNEPTPWCHCPPGNPTNCNTLNLPLSAIIQQGHLNHPEDHPGQCTPEEEPEP